MCEIQEKGSGLRIRFALSFALCSHPDWFWLAAYHNISYWYQNPAETEPAEIDGSWIGTTILE